MKRLIAVAAAVFLVSQSALAQHAQHKTVAKAANAVVNAPGAVNWGPAPAAFKPGARLAVLDGDPGGTGEFTVRLHLPAGYRIQPHFHPNDENVTVLKGVFHVGMGDKFTEQGGLTLPVGSFVTAHAGQHHYAWAGGDVIVQINGMGPLKITYVNPADDPSAKRASK